MLIEELQDEVRPWIKSASESCLHLVSEEKQLDA